MWRSGCLGIDRTLPGLVVDSVTRSERTFEVFRETSLPSRIAASRPSTLSLAPLRSSRLPPRPAHAERLSWGWTEETGSHRHLSPSPLHRPSLAGRLSRGHRARQLPDGKQASHPSAPGCQSRSHVPPSWFRTTSTACSARRLEGLLHPSADHGVRLVSCATARRPAHFPRRLPPLEELPRPAVGTPVTRRLGPLDVPPRSTRILTALPFPASGFGRDRRGCHLRGFFRRIGP